MQRLNTVLQRWGVITVLGLTSLALPLPAHARVNVSVGIGVPVVVAPAPVVVVPPSMVVGGEYYGYAQRRYDHRRYDRYPHRHGREGVTKVLIPC